MHSNLNTIRPQYVVYSLGSTCCQYVTILCITIYNPALVCAVYSFGIYSYAACMLLCYAWQYTIWKAFYFTWKGYRIIYRLSWSHVKINAHFFSVHANLVSGGFPLKLMDPIWKTDVFWGSNWMHIALSEELSQRMRSTHVLFVLN